MVINQLTKIIIIFFFVKGGRCGITADVAAIWFPIGYCAGLFNVFPIFVTISVSLLNFIPILFSPVIPNRCRIIRLNVSRAKNGLPSSFFYFSELRINNIDRSISVCC
jgi:hypothetical protein